MDNEKVTWKVHSESQDQRWKMMMNGRWKYGRYVWKFGMDGACTKCRVQVEVEKRMDG